MTTGASPAEPTAPSAPAAAPAAPSAPAAPAAPPAGAAAPTAPSAPNTSPAAGQPGGDPTSPSAGQSDPATPPAAEAYKIPEAYKEKPWAAKIKNEDDLFKMLDNLQTAVGKKSPAPDLSKMSTEEKEAHFAQTRPESIDAYQFPEGTSDEYKGPIAEMLYKRGLPADVANEIIADYSALETAKFAAITSKEGMDAEMSKSFGTDGQNWQQKTGEVALAISKNISADDRAMLDQLPNHQLGLLYRVANNLIAGYGVSESGNQANGGGSGTPGDVETERNTIRTQMREHQSKPFAKADDYAKLQARLDATYKNDPRLKQKK